MIDRGRNFDEYVQYEDPEKVFRKAFEEYRDQMLEFLVLPLSKIEDEILYSFSEKSKEFVFVKKENYGDKEIDVYYLDLTNEYAKQLHDYVISHRKIFGKTRKIFLESKNSNGTFLIMNHVEYKDFCMKITKAIDQFNSAKIKDTEIMIDIDQIKSKSDEQKSSNSSPIKRDYEESGESEYSEEGESEYDESEEEEGEGENEIVERVK